VGKGGHGVGKEEKGKVLFRGNLGKKSKGEERARYWREGVLVESGILKAVRGGEKGEQQHGQKLGREKREKRTAFERSPCSIKPPHVGAIGGRKKTTTLGNTGEKMKGFPFKPRGV